MSSPSADWKGHQHSRSIGDSLSEFRAGGRSGEGTELGRGRGTLSPHGGWDEWWPSPLDLMPCFGQAAQHGVAPFSAGKKAGEDSSRPTAEPFPGREGQTSPSSEEAPVASTGYNSSHFDTAAAQ